MSGTSKDAEPPAPRPPPREKGIASLFEVFEEGIQKVGLTLVTGITLVALALWLWPRGPAPVDGGAEGDFRIHLWRQVGAAKQEVAAGASLPGGTRVHLWVDAPYVGTFLLLEPGAAGGPAVLWPASGEPERTTGGRHIELGAQVEVPRTPGPRVWAATLCRLGSETPVCDWANPAAPRCPDGCLVTRVNFDVAP